MEMETCTSGACKIGLSACHAVLSIAITVTSFHRRAFFFFSIRLPHSEMALSFKGNYAGARVSFLKI